MVDHDFNQDQQEANYENEKVMEIRTMLGDFDFSEEQQPQDGNTPAPDTPVAVERRERVLLENQAKYEGEWIVG